MEDYQKYHKSTIFGASYAEASIMSTSAITFFLYNISNYIDK